jgi:hypothetical protein
MKYLDALLKGEEFGQNTRAKEPAKPPKPVLQVLQGAYPRDVGEKKLLPWSERMQTLTDWFVSHVAELPTAPFDLSLGIHIAEPARFYAVLQLDIDAGPNGARGRSGALEDDLTAIMERWAIQNEQDKGCRHGDLANRPG